MKTDEDGKPEIGNTARTLGVRTEGWGRDIVVAASGYALPETGGVSVSPPPPENLPEHRRPEEYGGTGNDPVWVLDTENLPSGLSYRPDPLDPEGHGFIEPEGPMHLDDYKALLSQSRDLWQRLQASP